MGIFFFISISYLQLNSYFFSIFTSCKFMANRLFLHVYTFLVHLVSLDHFLSFLKICVFLHSYKTGKKWTASPCFVKIFFYNSLVCSLSKCLQKRQKYAGCFIKLDQYFSRKFNFSVKFFLNSLFWTLLFFERVTFIFTHNLMIKNISLISQLIYQQYFIVYLTKLIFKFCIV